MKKKLLSLVLAGAMVASTSVSAFADDTAPTKQVEMGVGETEKDVNISITGDVLDQQGHAKPGNISVTVPTTATFTVMKDGEVTSANMTITNNSKEKIIVLAKGFEDADGQQNINLVKEEEFNGGKESVPRGKVWLKLTGGKQNLSFTSENYGKMYNNEYSKVVNEDENYEIDKIDENGSLNLKFQGQGGMNGDAANPIRNEFRLILKVKRAR